MAARLKTSSYRTWTLLAGSVGALLISNVALAQDPAPAEPPPGEAEPAPPPPPEEPPPAAEAPETLPLEEPPAPTGAIEGEVVPEPGAVGAAAAGADDGEVGEVVVTVDRREKNLQKYSGTASAFSEDQLERVGIENVRDLGASVPGLVIGVQEGSAEIFIRGVGSNNNTELGDPAVALHVDGVYIPRPRGAGAMFFDIERVEVNSGPQGTLYGRNAVGGNVNIVSKRPVLGEFQAYAQATFGTYSQRSYTGAINVPLGDTLAVRVAGWSEVHDPYWQNAGPIYHLPAAESADSYAFRGQIKYEPSQAFTALVAFDYIRERGTGWLGANFQGPLTRQNDNGTPDDTSDDFPDPYPIDEIDDPRRIYQRGMTPWYDLKHWGVRGDLSYDFGPVTAQLLGSFRDMRYVQRNGGSAGLVYEEYEFDNTGAPADNFSGNFWDQGSRSVVSELRFFAPETSRFRWTVGGFFFHEDQDTFLGSNSDPANGFAGTEFPMPDTKGTSYAGYADATFDIVKEFRVLGGIRLTHEKKGRHDGLFAIYGGFPQGGRFGTEGFQFQGANNRSILSVPMESTVEQRVNLFLDGIKSFGARDTVPQALCADPMEGQPRLMLNETGNFRCANGINPALLQQEEDFNNGVEGVGRPFDITATPQNNDVTNTFFDWRAGIEYDLAQDNLLYFTVSTGHKAAGFNDTTTVNGVLFDRDYDSESLLAFELGSKNLLADRRVRLNASAFYYRYNDQVFQTVIQVSPPNPDIEGSTGSSAALSQNAANSNILGLDIDFTYSLPLGLEANIHALLMDAKFGDGTTVNDGRLGFGIPQYEVDISGNWLPRTSPLTLNYSLSQVIFTDIGSFDWVVSGQTKLKQYMTPFNGEGNLLPRIDGPPPEDNPDYQALLEPGGSARLTDVIDGYTRFDIGAGWTHPEGRLSVSGFVNNVLDTTYVTSLISTPSLNLRFFNPPRTAGVRFRVEW